MGLFDNVFGGSSASKEVTKHEAYLGLMLAANASDGHVSQEEVQGFFTILMRMKLYREWNGDQLQQALDRMLSLLKKKEITEFVQICAKVLPEELRRPAFANCCDLILADGVVEDEEKEFINNLRRALDLSGDDAQTIAQVMVWKNQG